MSQGTETEKTQVSLEKYEKELREKWKITPYDVDEILRARDKILSFLPYAIVDYDINENDPVVRLTITVYGKGTSLLIEKEDLVTTRYDAEIKINDKWHKILLLENNYGVRMYIDLCAYDYDAYGEDIARKCEVFHDLASRFSINIYGATEFYDKERKERAIGFVFMLVKHIDQ